MNHSKSFHVLLVNPPVQSPAMVPLMPAQVAGYLSGTDLSIEQFDANIDFYLTYLLDPVRLTTQLGKIEKMTSTGPDVNPAKWRCKIADVGRSIEILRTKKFYELEYFIAALKNINDLLKITSMAVYPSRIKWCDFLNSTVKTWQDVPSFLENRETNPFLAFCHERLAPRIERLDQGFLILCVSAPGQLLAALTMALFSRKYRSDLHVALMGDLRLLAGVNDFCDTLLPRTDPEPLLKLLGRFGGAGRDDEASGPDFSGLPLKDYLAPGLVLPFVMSRIFSESSKLSSSLVTAMSEQGRSLNARGFLIEETGQARGEVANMMSEISRENPRLFIGLNCSFSTFQEKKEMAALFKAGVRLIKWQEPAGRLESITRLLQKASAAGIWNQVVIPAKEPNPLTEELIRFMTANPNIVHSWTDEHPSILPFPRSGNRGEIPLTDYQKIARLPGRPFWSYLNDPVYLLLYLNRYGLKKILRKRVQDDGESIYMPGQNLVYHFVAPKELLPGYMDKICRMVEAGGSVDTKWVRYNLERAFLIGYAEEEGLIAGNSSLKRPRPEYVKSVKERSGLDLSNYLERGYTSVRPEYRGLGIGTKLLEGLTARIGDRKLFSIIGEDNIATQKIAIRNRTQKVATFYSEPMGKEIGVWIPIRMLAEP
ncbi:MAG: GNAT family N-acetyltransferase [Desulfobacterales bacterium]